MKSGAGVQVQGVSCGAGGLLWHVVNKDIGKPKYAGLHMPKKFMAYTIDSSQLQSFFENVRVMKAATITIPVNGVCQTYRLMPSNTMSEELQAKYPEIQSYRGINTQNSNEYASVDYDGKFLKCRIETADGAIIIDPFQMNSGTYYLHYHIKDTGVPKVPFE